MIQVARNYAEWCDLSGLYLANLSHVDRYRTYGRVLSPAGLTVVVISEFLEDANPALDVNDWRSYRVYEFGPDQAERIERTALSLREIGAERLAQAVATSRSSSPFDALQGMLAGGGPDFTALAKSANPFEMLNSLQQSLGKKPSRGKDQAPDEGSTSLDSPPQKLETRQQVEELLEQFAQAHREELQADIDRHGDPRREPGFMIERRKRELDALRDRWISHQVQADAIETLTNVMNKIPKITTQKTEGKEKKTALHIKQLVRLFRDKTKELQKIAEADRSEQFQAFWPTREAFESEWAELLAPDVIGDAKLRRAAEDIGEFSAESKRKSTTLEWESPRGLKCDWTTFSLTVDVPAKSKPALRAALQAVERLRAQFPAVQEEWRRQTLESFRDVYQGQMDDEELEGYELNDEGEPTDAAILQHVESGSLVLSTADAEGRSFSLTAYLSVEWDPEHGFELECDVDLDDEETAESATTFDPGDVTLSDSGPTLSPEDLQQFESTFHFTLPGDYREFLLRSNGGVPSKPYIVLSRDGREDNWQIVRFLPFLGTTSAPFPAESLEGRLHLQDGSSLAGHLLPIARVRKGSFDPLNRSAVLAILLSGKKAGRVALFDVEMMLDPLLGTGETLEMALDELIRTPLVVAKDFSSLWRKLQPAPEIVIPDWLQFIRKNDVEAFLAWAAGGGKISERLIEPGADFQPTVVDLLAAEATDDLLDAVIQHKIVKPKLLRDSWRQYLFLDITRFRTLKPHLSKDQWHFVFASPAVWDHPDLLEELATAGVNIEAALDDEGGTALHRAVQLGRPDAVRWLLDHGADAKKEDRYGRNALLYAENGPGASCLPLLTGRPEPVVTELTAVDAPGLATLTEAAAALAPGLTLRLQIEIQSPSITRIEQVYYAGIGCHYRLTFEVHQGQVTYNDIRSPRQDYLHAKTWTEALLAPINQWPQLTPLWETLAVHEFELTKALKSRNYQPTPRPDLHSAAKAVLEQAFALKEAGQET